MSPLLYSLCNGSAIAPAAWIIGLCAFPPLFSGISLDLTRAATSAQTEFKVPVDKNYLLMLDFEFPTHDALRADTFVGTAYRLECDTDPGSLTDLPEYGRPVPVRVIIRNAVDRTVVLDKPFTSLCLLGHTSTHKSRRIGWLQLSRGRYLAEITNLTAKEIQPDTKVTVALVPGDGK